VDLAVAAAEVAGAVQLAGVVAAVHASQKLI
jgi:hypothetical protein